MLNVPKKIIIHHDGASRSGNSFDVINSYHKGLDFPVSRLGFYAGYHYVIERNGKVRQAREDNEIGAHTVGENGSSIGICLAGNFDTEDPTKAQTEALAGLLIAHTSMYRIPASEIYPHRKFAKKSCYGARLHDLWGREVLADALAKRDAANSTTPRAVVQDVITKLQSVLSSLT